MHRIPACLTAIVFTVAAFAAETVTIRNELHGFEITVPKAWSARRVVQQDPDQGFESGQFSFSISTSDEPEPKEWNGVVFNSTGYSDAPLPFVSVYAHRKPEQNPQDLSAMVEKSVGMFRGKILESNSEFRVKDAKGIDLTYDLFTKNRFVALYAGGTRVIVHYFLPSADKTLFDQYAKVVDAVVQSLRFRKQSE